MCGSDKLISFSILIVVVVDSMMVDEDLMIWNEMEIVCELLEKVSVMLVWFLYL